MPVKRTITFDPIPHRYTDEEGLVYKSVTTLINDVVPPFDTEKWSKYKSEQTGLPQSVIKQNWKDINKEACERGTEKHEKLETSIKDSQFKRSLLSTAGISLGGREFTNIDIDVLSHSMLAKEYPVIFLFLKKHIENGAKLYAEKRVYSYEHLVSGTIDLLLVKGNKFMIVDWKTNKKELYFKSGYYKKVNGIETDKWVDTNEYMLEPLTHVQNCKGLIYTIQLSLYAWLVEYWGLTCAGLVLFHIRDNVEPKLYNIPYDKSSAEFLLIHRKNSLTTINNNIKNTKFGITHG